MSRKKYTFMNGEYKPKIWFWEFVKMYNKLMIMICLTFYENNVPNKVNNLIFSYFYFFQDNWFLFRFYLSCFWWNSME